MAISPLNFPMNLGSQVANGEVPHYMLLTSYESKTAIGSGQEMSSIALYIPVNALTTTYGANYEGMNSAALMAEAGGAIQDAFTEKGKSAISGSLSKIGIQGGATSAALGFASKLIPTLGTAIGAGAGLAVNNHMALVYKGPNSFRSHTFNFMFFPKENPEAVRVREIIKDFKNGMLPRMVGAGTDESGKNMNGRLSSPFFKSPRHWTIKLLSYGSENAYVDMFPPKMKHVITNMTVNYDPQSIVSFHHDGSPVQTNLSLTFQELDFVTSGDAVDDTFATDFQTASMENQAQAKSLEERAKREKKAGLEKRLNFTGEARDKG